MIFVYVFVFRFNILIVFFFRFVSFSSVVGSVANALNILFCLIVCFDCDLCLLFCCLFSIVLGVFVCVSISVFVNAVFG